MKDRFGQRTAGKKLDGLSAVIDQRIAPVTMANEQLLPVPEPLAPLFPAGGLQQGWSVGFSGHGGWSLAMALLGAGLGADGWSACVGLEEFGLVAADELGLRLDRVLMVETPGPDQLATVIAALIEVVDVVCLGSTRSIGLRDARRLMARAREQNALLFHLDGGRSWPHPLDVALTVEPASKSRSEPGSWAGIGAGHGRLQARALSVTAVGRRSMAKPRRVDVLLPGPGGGVEVGSDVGNEPEPKVAPEVAPGEKPKEGVGEWPAFV
ncbi:MAG: hypothetical protein ACR2QK_23865 [Acidimicrobiales bacterium]